MSFCAAFEKTIKSNLFCLKAALSISNNTLTKSHEICECDYLVFHTSVDIETALGKTWHFPKKMKQLSLYTVFSCLEKADVLLKLKSMCDNVERYFG